MPLDLAEFEEFKINKESLIKYGKRKFKIQNWSDYGVRMYPLSALQNSDREFISNGLKKLSFM